MTWLDEMLAMDARTLCFHLIWDRRYGPEIQDLLLLHALVDEDCSRIADTAKSELRVLAAGQGKVRSLLMSLS